MLDPVVSLMLAMSGAVLFGSAAAHKLRSPALFVATLDEYRIVPRAAVTFVAVVIGALEIAAAAGLLWVVTRPTAAAVGAALLLAYAAAIALNLARGRRDLDCGCGGKPRAIAGWMVIRNLLLAALLCLLQIPTSARPMELADVATVGGGLLVAVLLYASVELLLGRVAPRALYSMERQ